MRLWSLHPKYLDPRGLVALWREALLAQAVLAGKTRGYRHHPQLARFRGAPSPRAAIAAYLRGVLAEAGARGYAFDAGKVAKGRFGGKLPVTSGQLRYEWAHLQSKLAVRDRVWARKLGGVRRPAAAPVFRVVRGGVEGWERRRQEAG
ncbi:MAG TPA: pyrimidine dimer DNA glycosylase/endonuclease V [Polyangia bacterium]